MATYSVNVTQSFSFFPNNLSGSQVTIFAVTNSLAGASYFSLETVANSSGFYSGSTPSISGSFTYDSGITNVTSDNYKMSAVVKPGGGSVTFTPATFITGSMLFMRGTGPNSPSTFLLDRYTGAAAAYSLRQLSSNYTGSAIRVRRSSDNTEQNIGFVDGVLDTASLLTFCGVGDGAVTTWYDQSGNNKNAVQSSAVSQPFVVVSGSIILDGSKPVIFGPGQKSLEAPNLIGSSHTWFSVHNVTSGSPNTDVDVLWTAMPSRLYVQIIGYSANYDGTTKDYFRAGTGSAISYTSYWGSKQLKTSIYTETFNLFDYKNGTLNYTGSFSDPIAISGTGGILIFGSWSGGSGSQKKWSEFIYYSGSVQSINRGGIESNINAYYGIY